ncbi:hypothetical protein GCM10010430_74930 [Kitasatospora cystarginea]|uniref:Carboxylic ester hydrolase n=1 Tax=Kitasatospora cystarginea TaxID=58350 RepID=A0ABP5RW22_9ACTN
MCPSRCVDDSDDAIPEPEERSRNDGFWRSRRPVFLMGGTKEVDDFYRVFLAPGVTHCGLNAGSVDDLAALTAWVEHGQAPNVLHATLTTATGQTVARDVYRYPMVSRYTGHGDPSVASSFRCVQASRD